MGARVEAVPNVLRSELEKQMLAEIPAQDREAGRVPAAPPTGRPGRAVGGRALLAAAVVLAVAACTPGPRASAPAAAPSAPAKVLFDPYPDAEIQAVQDPHDHRGKPLCQRCHHADGTLVGEPNALCAGCHKLGHGNHPVDVVQRTPAKGLPLLAGGKVACHTCHDPHKKKSPLRKSFNDLCKTCHALHR